MLGTLDIKCKKVSHFHNNNNNNNNNNNPEARKLVLDGITALPPANVDFLAWKPLIFSSMCTQKPQIHETKYCSLQNHAWQGIDVF
jgi:hypothetical protein